MKTPRLNALNTIYIAVLMFSVVVPAMAIPDQQTTHPFAARRIVVLRDVTGSFDRFLDEADREIRQIVSAMGPGDEVIVIDIGPAFDPSQNVVVQCLMPSLPADFKSTASNLAELRRRQDMLSKLWINVDKNRQELIKYLQSRPALQHGGTNLALPLSYAAKRLQDESGDKILILKIFSDLRTEMGNVKSSLPPLVDGLFQGVEVQVFLGPWQGNGREQVEQAWKSWFLKLKQAKSFQIFDTAESRVTAPLQPSPVPRTVASPFHEGN